MRRLLLVLIVAASASTASAQQVTGSATASATSILVNACISGLPISTSCTFTLKDAAGATVGSPIVQATGGTCRIAQHTGLTGSTVYKVNYDCGQPYDVVLNNVVVTPADPGGTTTVKFQLSSNPYLATAARATVNYGTTISLGTTSQNTNCSGGSCTLSPSIARGIVYYEIQTQNSSNTILARTPIDYVSVGGANTVTLTSSNNGAEPTIPDLASFNSRMLSNGTTRCAALSSFADNYYDIVQVFKLVGDYTGDTATWYPCRDTAAANWLNGYVLPNNGGLPGYRNITFGTRQLGQDTGRWDAIKGTIDLSINASYCHSPLAALTDPYFSREVAYCVRALMEARKLGTWNLANFQQRFNEMFIHLDKWFDGTYRFPNPEPNVPTCQGYYYLAPFMPTLTAFSMIQAHDEIPESEYGNGHTRAQIETYVKNLADFLWAQAWLPTAQSMYYQNCKPTFADAWPAQPGSPDLNLLISPMYAKTYQWTCDTTYRDEADAIWSGGIPEAYLGDSKHYAENHFWALWYDGYFHIRGPKELKQQDATSNILLEDNSKVLREVACP